jgi:hypothetical protein
LVQIENKKTQPRRADEHKQIWGEFRENVLLSLGVLLTKMSVLSETTMSFILSETRSITTEKVPADIQESLLNQIKEICIVHIPNMAIN